MIKRSRTCWHGGAGWKKERDLLPVWLFKAIFKLVMFLVSLQSDNSFQVLVYGSNCLKKVYKYLFTTSFDLCTNITHTFFHSISAHLTSQHFQKIILTCFRCASFSWLIMLGRCLPTTLLASDLDLPKNVKCFSCCPSELWDCPIIRAGYTSYFSRHSQF